MKTSVFSLGDKVTGTVNIALFGAFQVMLVVKNLPANAGDMGLIPVLGRFPQALEQLSLCATTTEPVL